MTISKISSSPIYDSKDPLVEELEAPPLSPIIGISPLLKPSSPLAQGFFFSLRASPFSASSSPKGQISPPKKRRISKNWEKAFHASWSQKIFASAVFPPCTCKEPGRVKQAHAPAKPVEKVSRSFVPSRREKPPLALKKPEGLKNLPEAPAASLLSNLSFTKLPEGIYLSPPLKSFPCFPFPEDSFKEFGLLPPLREPIESSPSVLSTKPSP